MARNRVEITDLPQPDQLRPAQRNIDTFTGAEKAPIDNDTQRLAEALQGFSRSLALFSHRKQDTTNDPRLAEAYRVISSSKDQGMVDGFKNGSLPYLDVPHVRALYEKDLGERVARAAVDDIRLGAQDGTLALVDNDGRPVDMQGLITERAQKFGGILQGSVHFQKAFATGIESSRNTLSDLVRTKVAEHNKGVNTTLVKSAIEDIIPLAARGDDDDKLRAAIADRTKAAKQYTGMNPREVDELYVGRLRELAKQDPDAAERILKLDRGKGFDGQPIGSLAQNPTYRKEVEEIAVAINEEREKRYDVAQKQSAAANAKQRLVAGDGSFSAITDHVYTNPFAAKDPAKNPTRTITSTQVKDEALSTFLQDSNAALQRQGTDPATSPASAETKFRREYEVFVNANRPHPEWSAQLQTTGRILSNPTSLSDPRNVLRVQQSATLYQTLMARNPGYTTETLGVQERERKFYDQMHVYQTLGEPANEAARKAADFVNKPPPPLTGDEIKKLREKADKLDFNGWSWGGQATNLPLVRQQVFDYARAIAADRQLPIDKVLDIAQEKVKERMVLLNGQVMPPSAYLTNESKPFFQTRLDELFKSNKQLLEAQDIDSASDLALREQSPGVFRVIGSGGQSVVIPQKDGSFSPLYVHARDIDLIRAQAREELKRNAILESQDAADKAIVTPAVRGFGRGNEPAVLDNLTPEDRQAAQRRIEDREYERSGVQKPRLEPRPEDNEPFLTPRSPRRKKQD